MFEKLKINKLLWFLPVIVIICTYLITLIYLTYPISQYSIEKAGQLGDSFGILNSLFSGLGFIALVLTIYLQQQDFRNSKKEIEKQNFENTFFKMLELYNNVAKDLILERPKIYTDIFFPDGTEKFSYTNYKIGEKLLFRGEKNFKGKEVIIELLKIYTVYKNKFYDEVINKYSKKIDYRITIYEDFHKEFENIIGHYFGTIYQILKFINNSNIENKEDYSNLFRAQFSKSELELLFHHGTSIIARKSFTALLIKYEFFEHLAINNIDDIAIKIYLRKTKKLNNNYPLNKVFGKNEKWKEKIIKLSINN